MSSRRSSLAACALLVACTGQIDQPQGAAGFAPGANADPVGGISVTSAQQALVGRTGPRRLSNTEYDQTVRDLLGSTQSLAQSFVAEEAGGFDNVASAMGMTPSQFESYLNAAEQLAAEFFADDARRKGALDCTPSGEDGGACLAGFLDGFGTRAFRRPLAADERAGLTRAYARALALGEAPLSAAEHVLTAMLASPAFLYRSELGELRADYVRPLDGYELASRLSYFLWSTMPDAALFARASDGTLTDDDTLQAELARMLDDPRAGALIDNFAAQWLGQRALRQHKVLPDVFPEFDDALRAAMLEESRRYFGAFLREDLPITEFLRKDLHFVNARLSAHYGLPAPGGADFVRIEAPIGERRGFLGLASFLTLSSFAQRTSPTLRAKWVLEELLCSHVPPPPPDVMADLEAEDQANAAATIENVRARLELHRSNPKCAGCHSLMDPIGLGLESFDGIGRSRAAYTNGDAIDTRGALPDGQSFAGPVELADILADDPRFPRCVTQKLMTYALGRTLDDEAALVDDTRQAIGDAGTLRTLIETIVLSPAFRQRLGSGGEP